MTLGMDEGAPATDSPPLTTVPQSIRVYTMAHPGLVPVLN